MVAWPFSQDHLRTLCTSFLLEIHGDQLSERYPTTACLAYKLWEYRCAYSEHGIPVIADQPNADADWYAAEWALGNGPPSASAPTEPAEVKRIIMGDAETVGHSILKAIVFTVDGTCPQCLRDAKSCCGQRWCPKWKRWRDCDIVCDEYWDTLNSLMS